MMAATAIKFPVPNAPIELLNFLVVDDEAIFRESCRQAAESLGFTSFEALDVDGAHRALDAHAIDVVMLDLKLAGGGGLELLREIKLRRPNAEVIVIAANASVQTAVQALHYGAYEYVTKPCGLDEVRLLLDRAAGHVRLSTENRVLRQKLKSKEGFGNIIGHAPEMEKLYRFICKAATSAHPVLIQGESGTGKEMVARAIHFSGPYRDKPFIPVDCGSLVPTLIESELFGYVKGAFTGAHKSKEGLLLLARGGTVFLDEIGELTTELQAKLLRAIQEKEIRPVGGSKTIPINVRILAATNRNLEGSLAQGQFRKDLYFRLNVLSLRIPPLRERKQDVPLLAGHFLERLSRTSGIRLTLSDEALRLMLSYDWPGNVRELENSLERASANTSGPILHSADLPTALRNSMETTAPIAKPSIVPVAEMERQAIVGALRQLNGDNMQAARLLGIGKTTLYRKLKEYQLAEFTK